MASGGKTQKLDLNIWGPKDPLFYQEWNENFQKIDAGVEGITEQLAHIGVDIKSFGAITDANYFNPVDCKYYADMNFTTLATDNASVFREINERYANVDSIKLFFASGGCMSSVGLDIDAKNIHIEGNSAKFIKTTPSSLIKSAAIKIDNCQNFKMNGLVIDHILEDKSIINTEASDFNHTFYHVQLTGNKSEKFYITDCEFIDNVSVPNATNKPYNGTLYLGKGKDVFIFGNKFVKVHGRIIYTSGCENVNVFDNQFEEVGYLPTEITNVNVQALVFRVLSSKRVKIHDNIINCTTVYNSKNNLAHGFMLGMNEQLTDVCYDVDIHHNTFVVNDLPIRVCNLSAVRKGAFRNNKIHLNDTNPNVTNYFLSIDDLRTESWMEALDVEISGNEIYNAHESSLYFFPIFDQALLRVLLCGNRFYANQKLTTLTSYSSSVLFVSSGVLIFEKNKIFENGIYKKDAIGLNVFDYNQNQQSLVVSSTNLATYLDGNGILNIPYNVNEVVFYGVNSAAFTITDITFDGLYLKDKKVTLRHTGGTYTPTLVNSGKLRLPESKNYFLSTNAAVSLTYTSSGNYWVGDDLYSGGTIGTTAQRPTTNLFIGRVHKDTTLKKTVTWYGTNWHDESGAIV